VDWISVLIGVVSTLLITLVVVVVVLLYQHVKDSTEETRSESLYDMEAAESTLRADLERERERVQQERVRADAERDRAEKLRRALEAERSKGFWSRLFGDRS
jgi:uncharacterized membrane protein YhiD involved in acid resistance